MAIISDDESRRTKSVLVRVLVSDGAGSDFASQAQRRLSRIDGVIGVTTDELCDMTPATP